MSTGSVISRRKLAGFIADTLQSGDDATTVIKQAAAYLIETRQIRSAGLLVRDIEEALLERGIVVADVTTAHPIGKEERATLAKLFPSEQLHIRETIDASVLGGIRVEVPGKRFDGTLQHKIDLLKEITTKKGTK